MVYRELQKEEVPQTHSQAPKKTPRHAAKCGTESPLYEFNSTVNLKCKVSVVSWFKCLTFVKIEKRT